MRRGEYFPIYRATQLGGRRTKPFTRPAKDSLPHHECAVKGCGGPMSDPMAPGWIAVSRGNPFRVIAFCSLGCLGRWAALEELRA